MRRATTVGLLALGLCSACASLSYDGLGETATTGASPTPSVTQTPVGQLYSSDFEKDDGGLVSTVISGQADSWGWGIPVGGAHSGTHAWATGLNGNYDQSEQSCLALELQNVPAAGATIDAWVAFQIEQQDEFRIRVCDTLGNCTTSEDHGGQGDDVFREYSTQLPSGNHSIEWCVVANGLFPEDGVTVDDVTAKAN